RIGAEVAIERNVLLEQDDQVLDRRHWPLVRVTAATRVCRLGLARGAERARSTVELLSRRLVAAGAGQPQRKTKRCNGQVPGCQGPGVAFHESLLALAAARCRGRAAIPARPAPAFARDSRGSCAWRSPNFGRRVWNSYGRMLAPLEAASDRDHF